MSKPVTPHVSRGPTPPSSPPPTRRGGLPSIEKISTIPENVFGTPDTPHPGKLQKMGSFVKQQLSERPVRSILLIALVGALVAVLGGVLFKFAPVVKAFTPIAQAIKHIPQLNALNGFVPLIAGGGLTGVTVGGLAVDHYLHQEKKPTTSSSTPNQQGSTPHNPNSTPNQQGSTPHNPNSTPNQQGSTQQTDN